MPYCALEDADCPTTEAAAPGLAALFDGVPLPSRTRPGPPLDPDADWAAFVRLVRPLLRDAPEDARLRAADFAARLEREPAALDAAGAVSWVTALLAASPTLRPRLEIATLPQVPSAARAVHTHLARWIAARSGSAVLVACLDVLGPQPTSKTWSLWKISNAVGVRGAFAVLPEAQYEAAVAECRRRAEAIDDVDVTAYLSYVLADDRPNSNHELRADVQLQVQAAVADNWRKDARLAPLIVDLPPRQAVAYLPTSQVPFFATSEVAAAEAAATAVAAAAQAGETPTPTLVWLMQQTQGADKTTVAKALLATRADDALPALLPFVGAKLVRDALDAADVADPAWMLRAGLAAMDGKATATWGPRVAALIARYGADAARAWAKGGSQTIVGRLERLLAARNVRLAPRDAWPAVLRDPPWRRKGRARQEIVLDLTPIATPFVCDLEGLDRHERFLSGHVVRHLIDLPDFLAEAEAAYGRFAAEPRFTEPLPTSMDSQDVLAWLRHRLDFIVDPRRTLYADLLQSVTRQPEPLALLLWEESRLLLKIYMVWRGVVPRMIERFGAAAMPGLGKLAMIDPIEFLPILRRIDAGEIAPAAARALVRVKRARADAVAWLHMHPRTAAMRLLPDSLGPLGPAREAADPALSLIGTMPEGRGVLDAAIAAYALVDPRVPAAVAAGIDSDPVEHAPAKAPRLPSWIVPSALTPPHLRDGDALPDDAVATLCEMLAFSSPLAPYAGVAQVREACTGDSLDAFAMDLFRAWLGAGANAASDWAMRAMAQVGSAACARDLTRQIRVWAVERAKPKALAGIDLLAAMGSDVALMNLNAIAEKSGFAKLRARATERIGALAEARGLSLDELADRLTPDLGLDDRGGLDLSYGPRQFRVGFDEMLRPWVRDAAGRRLATLPRPAKADVAAQAKAAARRWSGLKRDAEAVAALQVSRLETMMSRQRRVTRDVFDTFFAGHPLMRHLTGRLVWGVFDGPASGDGLVGTFRIAEDLSLTDAEDAAVVLDGRAGVVGPVHPLHLPPETLVRWSALFADYEIPQPFPQLGRETFSLDADEARSARLLRFDGKRVAGARLRGLRPQGWATESGSDTIPFVERPVWLATGERLDVLLAFEDGLSRHPAGGDGIQTLRALTLRARDGASVTRRFGDLDAVTASEVLRTPSLLAAAGV